MANIMYYDRVTVPNDYCYIYQQQLEGKGGKGTMTKWTPSMFSWLNAKHDILVSKHCTYWYDSGP